MSWNSTIWPQAPHITRFRMGIGAPQLIFEENDIDKTQNFWILEKKSKYFTQKSSVENNQSAFWPIMLVFKTALDNRDPTGSLQQEHIRNETQKNRNSKYKARNLAWNIWKSTSRYFYIFLILRTFEWALNSCKTTGSNEN